MSDTEAVEALIRSCIEFNTPALQRLVCSCPHGYERFTNDNYSFLDQTQIVAYHKAWAGMSSDQLLQLAKHVESLKPSVVFALREAEVLHKSESDVEVRRSLADLNRILSDVKTEQELRERRTTR